MSLQGTFDTLAITELLGLLVRSRKSGVLALETPASDSRLWLLDGRCSAVEAGDRSGPAETPGDLHGRLVDVCFEFARREAGSFKFADGGAPPWPTAYEVGVDDALDEVHRLLDEWQEIRMVIPSLDARPRLSPELGCPSMTIDAAQWEILAALDGTRSVDDVVIGSKRSLMEVCGVLREMVERGAVEVVSPDGATPDGEGASQPESGAGEAAEAGALADLADLAKSAQDARADTPSREAVAADPDDRAGDARGAAVEEAPVGVAVVQPVAPYGPGVDPPDEPEDGSTRDRGAMLRLFSAIREL